MDFSFAGLGAGRACAVARAPQTGERSEVAAERTCGAGRTTAVGTGAAVGYRSRAAPRAENKASLGPWRTAAGGSLPGSPSLARRLPAPACVQSSPARFGLAVVWAGVKLCIYAAYTVSLRTVFDSLHEGRNFVNFAVFLSLLNFGWVAAAEASEPACFAGILCRVCLPLHSWCIGSIGLE